MSVMDQSLGTAEELSDLQIAHVRATIYSFIANFLATAIPVPGDEYARSLMDSFEEFLSDGSRAHEESQTYRSLQEARQCIIHDAREEQKRLAIDRTRFVRGLKESNPVKPPFESLYLTPNDALEEISDIAGFYKNIGYQLDAKQSANRPDSLETECLLMAQLCMEQAESIEEGDDQRSVQLVGYQSNFIKQHIGAWAPDFCNQAAQHASSALFKGLMLFASDFLQAEKELVA